MPPTADGASAAVAVADAIGQALLERGLGPDRPLLVLSGNSVELLYAEPAPVGVVIADPSA